MEKSGSQGGDQHLFRPLGRSESGWLECRGCLDIPRLELLSLRLGVSYREALTADRPQQPFLKPPHT